MEALPADQAAPLWQAAQARPRHLLRHEARNDPVSNLSIGRIQAEFAKILSSGDPNF